jgi:hypothetical protein
LQYLFVADALLQAVETNILNRLKTFRFNFNDFNAPLNRRI